MTLSLDTHKIFERRKDIIRLITPLVPDRKKIEVRQIGAKNDIRLGLVNPGTNPASIIDIDSTRIPSKIGNVYINYYEVWMPADKKPDLYDLERIYLHIHIRKKLDENDKQILSLHCDPLTKKGDHSYIYKKAPHMHIGGASPDISRSHIGLCLNDNNFGGKDISELNRTFELAVGMIESELIARYS